MGLIKPQAVVDGQRGGVVMWVPTSRLLLKHNKNDHRKGCPAETLTQTQYRSIKYILWLCRCTRRRWTSGRLCSEVRIYTWRSRTRTWRTPRTCTSTAPASSQTPGTSEKYNNSAWQRCPISRIKWYSWWLIMILHLAFLCHFFTPKKPNRCKKVWRENRDPGSVEAQGNE